MPIYEYQCSVCGEVYEKLELRIVDIPTSPCPCCQAGVGTRMISAPAIIYEVFDERAVHRLPDWNQKMTQAKVHDARVRRNPRLAALEHDKGQGIKKYEMEFGRSERDRLINKAQLDNMG
jgi:putative FmdB family regulatory protein